MRAANLATDADLDPYKPGGERNSRKDARGYLNYLTRLHRFHARGETVAADSERLRADAAVMAALRDEPIRVPLVQPIRMKNGDGKARPTDSLLVYPKSLEALLEAHNLDVQLGWLLLQKERVTEAGARGMPRASEVMDRVVETIAYTYGLLCWIMTSPGPELPYRATPSNQDPELPQYIRDLQPIDGIQIVTAAQKHHGRLAALQILVDRRTRAEGGKRPSWSQFVGSLAVELDGDSVHVSCFRSLGSLLATVQLDAYTKEPDDDSPAAVASHPTAGTLA